MPFIIKPENIGTSNIESVVEATPNTVPERGDDASIKVGLKFPEWAKGYPLPMQFKPKNTLNILAWDGTVSANTTFSGGTGTVEDPYIISNPSELAFLCRGADGTTANKYYKIADGIDAFDMNCYSDIAITSTIDDIKVASRTTNSWTTTYANGSTSAREQFMGNFDGNNVVIYNLYSSGNYAGLFPAVTASPVLGFKNIIIKNSAFNSTATTTSMSNGVGAIVGAHTNWGMDDTVNGGTCPFPFENCVVMDCCFTGYGPLAYICGNSRHAPIKVDNCLMADSEINMTTTNSAYGGACAVTQNDSYTKIITNTVYINVFDISSGLNLTFDDITDTTNYTYTRTQGLWNNSVDTASCYSTRNWKDITNITNYPTYVSAEVLCSEFAIQNTNLNPLVWKNSFASTSQAITLESALGLFESITPFISALKNTSDNRKVVSYHTNSEKTTLDYGAFYIIWHNSGGVDFRFVDSLNEDAQIIQDGDGKDLANARVSMLFLPSESYHISSTGTVIEQAEIRCFVLSLTSETINIFSGTGATTKQFVMPKGSNVVLQNLKTSYGISIFKIQL